MSSDYKPGEIPTLTAEEIEQAKAKEEQNAIIRNAARMATRQLKNRLNGLPPQPQIAPAKSSKVVKRGDAVEINGEIWMVVNVYSKTKQMTLRMVE